MIRGDLQTILKAIVIVGVTSANVAVLVSSVPPDRSLTTILVGNTLLFTVFAALWIAIDMSKYGQPQALQLLPQTQLALWAIGLVSLVLASDRFQWFDTGIASLIFWAAALTIPSRDGFRWLWRRMSGGG